MIRRCKVNKTNFGIIETDPKTNKCWKKKTKELEE